MVRSIPPTPAQLLARARSSADVLVDCCRRADAKLLRFEAGGVCVVVAVDAAALALSCAHDAIKPGLDRGETVLSEIAAVWEPATATAPLEVFDDADDADYEGNP